MHILFLSQVLPYPLDAGPKMRSYYVLRHLVQKHEVTLLTFVRDNDNAEDIAHLADLCYEVHTISMRRSRWRDLKFLMQSVIKRHPFLIVRDEMPAMNHKIQQLAQATPFDAVHADQLWMAQYALPLKREGSPKLILDQHNATFLIPQRMAGDAGNFIKRQFLKRETKLLAAYEQEVCRQFDQVVWVTAEDRQAVASLSSPNLNGFKHSPVIPICADPKHVEPFPLHKNKRRITFLGGLHWPPNAGGIRWFVEKVFPKVQAVMPEVELTIIGKNPPDGLVGKGIEITGYVPDLTPYLADTTVFIVPLHAGGGMRVKILDAWSWGLPIVSTTIGAEGIEIENGQNMLIADTPETFSQAVLQVLKKPDLAAKLRRNGRQTVRQEYDWRVIYSGWDKVYHEENVMMKEA